MLLLFKYSPWNPRNVELGDKQMILLLILTTHSLPSRFSSAVQSRLVLISSSRSAHRRRVNQHVSQLISLTMQPTFAASSPLVIVNQLDRSLVEPHAFDRFGGRSSSVVVIQPRSQLRASKKHNQRRGSDCLEERYGR